ncbi:uncharacterized protein LOC127810875 isoform X2 [Diospyros lotus]|uniref:uncharacterized protein LOC127810875 isoform X2 n=1 Tax=Diospyros lotus TaxID=55363 RepID=UPI002250567F|nr:uncharacterized protein LOC127810875 isoform X2 [Diospyros lotus]
MVQTPLTQNPESAHITVSATSRASDTTKTMYPKVKVREEEDDDVINVHALDGLQSLSIHDVDSPVREFEDDSPASIVRIPKSYIPGATSPTIPLSRGEGENDSKKKALEDKKTNTRASSVPRPRAVLSSPDNDVMIRSRNKAKTGLLSGLKDNDSCQNRHTQCKVTPRRSAFETTKTTRRVSVEVADGLRGSGHNHKQVKTDSRTLKWRF